jgi:hypothetical protein
MYFIQFLLLLFSNCITVRINIFIINPGLAAPRTASIVFQKLLASQTVVKKCMKESEAMVTPAFHEN